MKGSTCSKASVASRDPIVKATKTKRRVNIGWVNGRNHKQVRVIKGGGLRRESLEWSSKREDILRHAIDLFFPEGVSPIGVLLELQVDDLLDFKDASFPTNVTLSEFYERYKTGTLNVYLHTMPKKKIEGTGEGPNIPPLVSNLPLEKQSTITKVEDEKGSSDGVLSVNAEKGANISLTVSTTPPLNKVSTATQGPDDTGGGNDWGSPDVMLSTFSDTIGPSTMLHFMSELPNITAPAKRSSNTHDAACSLNVSADRTSDHDTHSDFIRQTAIQSDIIDADHGSLYIEMVTAQESFPVTNKETLRTKWLDSLNPREF